MTTTNAPSDRLPSGFGLYRLSWRALLVNLYSFFYLAVLPYIVVLCAGVLEYSTLHSSIHWFYRAVAWVTLAAATGLFVISVPALFYVQLQSVKGIRVEYSEALRESSRYFWRIWGFTLVGAVALAVGLLLFVVPGLYLVQRFILSPYLITDKDLSVPDALRTSAELARANSTPMWQMTGVLTLIYAIYLFVPLVGPLIGWVLGVGYYCAPAAQYTQIAVPTEKSQRVPKKTVKAKIVK